MKKIIKRETIRYDVKGTVSGEIIDFEDGTSEVRYYHTGHPNQLKHVEWVEGFTVNDIKKQEDDES